MISGKIFSFFMLFSCLEISFVYSQDLNSSDSLRVLIRSAQESELANLYNDLGYSFRLINRDSAEYYLNLADTLNKQYPDIFTNAKINVSKARLDYFNADYEKSHSRLSKADSIFTLLGKKSFLIQSKSQLGLIHAVWEEHNFAMDYYLKALDLAKEERNDYYISLTNYRMGISMKDSDRLDSALTYFNISLKTARNLKNNLIIGRDLMMMAETELFKNNISKSIELINEAETYFEKTNKWDLGYLYGIRSQALLKNGNPLKAIEWAKKGLDIQKEFNYKWELLRLYGILADAYSKNRDYEKANYYFRLNSSYKDSVFNEQKQSMILHQEVRNKDLENKTLSIIAREQEALLNNQFLIIILFVIILLSLSIIIAIIIRNNKRQQLLSIQLEEKNKELQELVNFKSEILSLVGHDMYNMISSLGGFISLFNTKDMSLADFERIAPVLESNIEHIRISFNNLIYWAESQKDGLKIQSKALDICEYFKQIKELYASIIKQNEIQVTINCDENLLIFFDGDQLNMILRNFIHNAIKYTPNGGSIILSAMKNSEKEATISVKDSGIGIPDEVIRSILSKDLRVKSNNGVRSEKGNGLGLKLVHKYLHLNNSSLQIESKKDKGSSFAFVTQIVE